MLIIAAIGGTRLIIAAIGGSRLIYYLLNVLFINVTFFTQLFFYNIRRKLN